MPSEGADTFKVLHDTFHHYLAGESEIFPERTGLVHISGVEDRSLAHNDIRDRHRILVGEADLLGNVAQVKALRQGGYHWPLLVRAVRGSSVHAMADVAGALRQSMALIGAGCRRSGQSMTAGTYYSSYPETLLKNQNIKQKGRNIQ